MRLTRYYLPVLKETPSEAQIASHQLMLRAGMIRQESAGIYAWLPLGFRVLKKIEQIVREEQDRAGAVEMLMPTIQSAELWRESGRPCCGVGSGHCRLAACAGRLPGARRLPFWCERSLGPGDSTL